MKIYFAIAMCLMCLATAKAQWVTTVAGIIATPGSNDGPALNARFFNPHGIAVDSTGKVYVADRYNHTIRLFDPAVGLVSTMAGQAGESGSADGMVSAARFNEPWGICVTPGGVVYVADTKNNKIRKIQPNGMVSTIAGTGNFGTSDGPVLSATFGSPTGIEIDSIGNIYVADHLTHIIRKISINGIVSTIAGKPHVPGDVDGIGSEAQFWRPYGLSLDSQGDLLIADEWNHKIRRVTPQGLVTTIAGNGEEMHADGSSGAASFNFPWDMTVDPNGNIYVADGWNYVVRKIDTNGMVTTIAGMPQSPGGQDGEASNASFGGITSIAWSAHTATLYTSDANSHLVREIILNDSSSAVLNLTNLIGQNFLCEGEQLDLQASPSIYDNYRFFLDSTLVQDGNSSVFNTSNLQPGTYEFTVESVFQGQVLISNSITVTISPLPQIDITVVGELSFFEGDSVILIASGAGDFLWSNGETTQTITIFESGIYFVELTINGCTGISQEVVVEVTPLPDEVEVVIEGSPVLCPGKNVLLVSSEPIGNQWLKDGWPMPGKTTQRLEVFEAGIYQVQVNDGDTGITILSESVEITEAPIHDFDFIADPRSAEPGQMVSFRSVGTGNPIAYLWDFGDPTSGNDNQSVLISPTHRYELPGIYPVELTATDNFGCEHVISKIDYVVISEEPAPILDEPFLPNAFTPNGDGENDVFRIRGYSGDSYSMLIYNQWGDLLFQSTNPADGWDGYRNNLPVDLGTYVYLVEISSPLGTKQLSGHVTLLR